MLKLFKMHSIYHVTCWLRWVIKAFQRIGKLLSVSNTVMSSGKALKSHHVSFMTYHLRFFQSNTVKHMSAYGAHLSLAKSVFWFVIALQSFFCAAHKLFSSRNLASFELAVETLNFLLSAKSLCLARTFIATSEYLVHLKDSCISPHLNGRGRLIVTGPIGKNMFFAGFDIASYSKDGLNNWWKIIWIRTHSHSLYMHATVSGITYNTKISGQN